MKNSQLESVDADDTALHIGTQRIATLRIAMLNIGLRDEAGRDTHRNPGAAP